MANSGRRAVTSPQTRLAHARGKQRMRWRAPRLEAAEAERAATLYRIQRRRGAQTLALLFGLLFGLPAVLAAVSGVEGLRLIGVPASWLALVLLPFPAMVLLAWWQLRRAERAEDR